MSHGLLFVSCQLQSFYYGIISEMFVFESVSLVDVVCWPSWCGSLMCLCFLRPVYSCAYTFVFFSWTLFSCVAAFDQFVECLRVFLLAIWLINNWDLDSHPHHPDLFSFRELWSILYVHLFWRNRTLFMTIPMEYDPQHGFIFYHCHSVFVFCIFRFLLKCQSLVHFRLE